MSKAEKLVSRGSETPEVARAAGHIGEMLIRLYMNQPSYFAEAVARAIPDFEKEDAESLRSFFRRVADYFDAEAVGRPYPPNGQREQIREWGKSEVGVGCYNILRVLAVLACDLSYCADNPDCWETRRAFCRMGGPQGRILPRPPRHSVGGGSGVVTSLVSTPTIRATRFSSILICSTTWPIVTSSTFGLSKVMGSVSFPSSAGGLRNTSRSRTNTDSRADTTSTSIRSCGEGGCGICSSPVGLCFGYCGRGRRAVLRPPH